MKYFLSPYGIDYEFDTYECKEVKYDEDEEKNHIYFISHFTLIQQQLDVKCRYPFIVLLNYIFFSLHDLGEIGSLENIMNFIKENIRKNNSIYYYYYYFRLF